MRTCSTCIFFVPSGQNAEGEIGYCRANPPQCATTETGKATVGKFPIVLGSMWCGIWEERD